MRLAFSFTSREDLFFAMAIRATSVTFRVMRVWLSALILVAVGCDRAQRTAPPHPEQVDYFAKKCECYELAAKRRAHDTEENDNRHNPNAYTLGGEQCYVPTMNTCIYESGTFVVPASKSVMAVEDLLTGQQLASGLVDVPAYKQERERLFSLCAK
jgi:hypothetical protein